MQPYSIRTTFVNEDKLNWSIPLWWEKMATRTRLIINESILLSGLPDKMNSFYYTHGLSLLWYEWLFYTSKLMRIKYHCFDYFLFTINKIYCVLVVNRNLLLSQDNSGHTQAKNDYANKRMPLPFDEYTTFIIYGDLFLGSFDTTQQNTHFDGIIDNKFNLNEFYSLLYRTTLVSFTLKQNHFTVFLSKEAKFKCHLMAVLGTSRKNIHTFYFSKIEFLLKWQLHGEMFVTICHRFVL